MKHNGMNDELNKALHEAITGKDCICPSDCDCEDFEAGLVSNECPIHNDNPICTEGCPVHDEEGDVPSYTTDLKAAFDLVEWIRKTYEAWPEIKAFGHKWQVAMKLMKNGSYGYIEHESLPMAISLACAKALNIEVTA